MKGWVLHISDPHLGQGHKLDDEKDELAGQPDVETSQRVFERTLKILREFVEEHGKPASVVISGDVTYRNATSGFERFRELPAEFAEVFPDDNRRIVVVPGNHDVDWDSDPGVPSRYERFVAATRTIDCTTPLLDGVDFDPETGRLSGGGVHHHVETDDFVIVPLNSSNYCGVLTDRRGAMSEEAWFEALAPTGDAREGLMKELRRNRQVDMARISRPQIEALEDYVREIDLLGEEGPHRRLRIAVLHHQLLPLSTREERKPYESLVDLGLVRETLRDYEFDLVLHGHKHESGLYWDTVTPAGDEFGGRLRRIFVISSPGDFEVGGPTMRAIVAEGAPSARNVRVVTFGGAGANRRHPHVLDSHDVPLWTAAGARDVKDEVTVCAEDAHTAYGRLKSLFELRGGETKRNLMCTVEHPDDAGSLPPDYPVSDGDPQEWFSELVAWWQKDRSELVQRGLVPFNHGERIRRRWGDQVERAIKLLDERRDSSRAVVALVAPRETGRYLGDERPLDTGSFPAFVLAEFSISSREGKDALDCVGYFRKQEMQYWWPVNLAELASLQDEVRSGLKSQIGRGRITTFAAIALWESGLPRVAVPMLDRLLEDPERLIDMALAVSWPQAAEANARKDWQEVLADLSGKGRARPPRPKAGMEALYELVSRFAKAGASQGAGSITACLAELRDQYSAYPPSAQPTKSAVDVMIGKVENLEKAVSATLDLSE